MRRLTSFTVSLLFLAPVVSLPAQWRAAEAPLMTRWATEVAPDNVHPEYPRPQMVRPLWQNLNGLWEYAIRPKDATQPESFDGRLLVPFPVESAAFIAVRSFQTCSITSPPTASTTLSSASRSWECSAWSPPAS